MNSPVEKISFQSTFSGGESWEPDLDCLPMRPKTQQSSSWDRFVGLQPPETWPALEKRCNELQTSSSSSQPLLNHLDKRPLRLDPLPYTIDQELWQEVCRGLEQRTRLLNLILSDLYGAKRIMSEGWISPREIHKAPSFIPPNSMDEPPPQLHLYNCRLVFHQGRYHVLRDNTSIPEHLGSVLEHRILSNRYLDAIQRELHMRRMASWFQHFREGLFRSIHGPDQDAFGVVLSSGIESIGYEQHAYLAQYLGCPLVEPTDLTVRHQKVYLKNLNALERVYFILRRVPELGFDPLEDSHPSNHGIAGISEARRSGGVFLDSPPGVGILESPFLFHSFPQLSRNLLGEDLLLPQMEPGWQPEGDYWPTVRQGVARDQPFVLHLTISCFGDDIRILPGGLALSTEQTENPTSVKDVWICGESFPTVQVQRPLTPAHPNVDRRQGVGLPSRVADATLWFGRYLERGDTLCRMLREILVKPQRESALLLSGGQSLALDLLQDAMEIEGPELREQPWLQRWNHLAGDADVLGSLHYNLRCIGHNAMMLRDRISNDMIAIAKDLTLQYNRDFGTENGEWVLTRTLEQLAALTGLSIDSMTHCDEWNFLVIGRRLERSCSTASLMITLLEGPRSEESENWELLLRTFDSIMTYRWRFRLQLEPASVVEMMVRDLTNPRSIAYQMDNLVSALQAMVLEGASWAVQPYQNLRQALEQIKSMNPGDLTTDLEHMRDQLVSIREQLFTFYDDLTRTLHHQG